MATKQVQLRRIALLTNALAAGAILPLTLVLGSGKGGTWTLPVFLTFEAMMLALGLMFAIRAQRAGVREP